MGTERRVRLLEIRQDQKYINNGTSWMSAVGHKRPFIPILAQRPLPGVMVRPRFNGPLEIGFGYVPQKQLD